MLRVDPVRVELVGNGIFLGRSFHRDVFGLGAFCPLGAHHIGDLLAVAMAADDQALDGVGVDLTCRGHRGGIKQAQDLFERFRIAIMRRRRSQQERFRGGCEGAGELIVLRADVGGIVDLIHDHGIPADLLQLRAVLRALQRVHGDDNPREIRERIAASRQFLADLLNAVRIQAHQRDGETRPEFLLKLLHDVLRGDHQDALTAAAADELCEDHADFQSFTQADGVGNEHAGAEVIVGKSFLHR